MNKKINKLILTFAMLLPAIFTFAQEALTDSESIARYKNDYSYWIMIAFLIATVLGFVYAAIVVTKKSKENTKETTSLDKVLYNSVAIDDEESIMLEHEYDGIRELDNHLPPWWLWLFYINIIFAVIYFGYYTVTGMGASQLEEYESEMIYAENFKADLEKKMASEFDENNVAFLKEESKIAEGKELYIANCAVCHKADLGGLIGPNLTDEYWVHGGSPTEIYAILRDGVLEKGMLAWKDQMTPYQMQNIMSYILTMQGTNPENAKAPEGEKNASIEELNSNELEEDVEAIVEELTDEE